MAEPARTADDVATLRQLQPEVEHLARTVRDLGLAEVTVRVGSEGAGARLEVQLRGGGPGSFGRGGEPDGALPASAGPDAVPAGGPAVPPPGAAGSARDPGAVDVGAPLVGVFYRRPTPDEPAFVEAGAEVAVGDPIGIVEAMKMMNRVPATVAGTVLAVHAADADIVEYGQPLVSIRPAPVAS